MNKVYFKQTIYAFNPLQHKEAWKVYELGKWVSWKGGKKVKPYLEVKVVKVKKEKINCDVEFICPICNKMLHHKDKVEQKGNWVNGENLDKIKFPCFCSYIDRKKKTNLGMITANFFGGFYQFTLHYINNQINVCEEIQVKSIRKLIKDFDIHILKGKIIIFEEE